MAYKSQHKATLTDSRAPVEKVGSNSTHLEVKRLRSKYAVLLAAAIVFLAASARGQETNGLKVPRSPPDPARRMTRTRRITRLIHSSRLICRITSCLPREDIQAALVIRGCSECRCRWTCSVFINSYAQSCRSTRP